MSELAVREKTHDVALLIENEVVCAGLETVLLRMPQVGQVETCRPEKLDDLITSASVDVIVTAVEQWPLLGKYDKEATPPVLLLGDGEFEQHSDMFTALPVDGFLSVVELSARSLADALDRVVAGELPMPSSMARRLLAGNRTVIAAQSTRTVSLTPRETETLSLLAKGFSNKQIARSIGISIHGAKRLVGSVLMKLGAPNRTAAVITAMQEDLI